MPREPKDRSVSPAEALRILQREVTSEDRDAASDGLVVEFVTLLRAMHDRDTGSASDDDGDGGDWLDDAPAAAVLRLTGEVIRIMETYELAVMRRIYHKQGGTWQDVADLHPRLDGRSAAQKRFTRLKDDQRRVRSGDFHRGAAVKRSKPPVIDSSTAADEAVSQ